MERVRAHPAEPGRTLDARGDRVDGDSGRRLCGVPRGQAGLRLGHARNPKKQAKAEARYPPDRRTERVKEYFRSALGGATAEEYEARLKEASTKLGVAGPEAPAERRRTAGTE